MNERDIVCFCAQPGNHPVDDSEGRHVHDVHLRMRVELEVMPEQQRDATGIAFAACVLFGAGSGAKIETYVFRVQLSFASSRRLPTDWLPP